MKMKNNNQENRFGRRDFFRKTAQKSIPILALLSLPPVMVGCGGDDEGEDDWQGGSGGSGGQGENGGISGVSSADGTISGHGYVDLGLSVKWATCNLGTSADYGDGNLYEGVASDKDLSESLQCWNRYTSMQGTIFDYARKEWGTKWMLPTRNQLKELLDNCNLSYITYKGNKGFKATSKKNGKSIFLAAAGYGDYNRSKKKWEYDFKGTHVAYWTADIHVGSDNYCKYFEIWINSQNKIIVKEYEGNVYLTTKFSVRPVSSGSGTTTGCNGNCTANCANNSTSSGCSGCSSSCSSGCKQNCDYNCAATCKSHCYGQCNDTCGGTCKYVSSGSSCSGCASSCYNRCYHSCSYACSNNCESSCVHGSK